MATFVKFNKFIEYLTINKVIDLNGDTLMVYLTNNAPDAATHTVKAGLAGITEQNGYAAADIQNACTQSGGTATVTATDVTYTGTGAGFGPFRYAVIYDDTPTSPADPLIGYYDYGSSISVLNGETFKVDFGATFLTFA